ncbi:hypothetical protein [Endozoicomonas euniceicola]|uniref:Uncharacterized protein n=1 Tax=Endozoicomonas euniceicola TaxID=1234143 RepID=A0ABY6GWY8_9GAMM|nr:hypothetical protein [Endozoicomonas euniceicola]UYM17072.1 hypothetical protein NX720_03850 [Endozoicomonas euniceicola]
MGLASTDLCSKLYKGGTLHSNSGFRKKRIQAVSFLIIYCFFFAATVKASTIPANNHKNQLAVITLLPLMRYVTQGWDSLSLSQYPSPEQARVSSPDPIQVRAKKLAVEGDTHCFSAPNTADGQDNLWSCFNQTGIHKEVTISLPVSHINHVQITAFQTIDIQLGRWPEPDKDNGFSSLTAQESKMGKEIRQSFEHEERVHEALEKRSEILRAVTEMPGITHDRPGSQKYDNARIRLIVNHESDDSQKLSSIHFKLINGHSREEEKEFQDNLESIQSGGSLRRFTIKDSDHFDLLPETGVILSKSSDEVNQLIQYLPNSDNSGSGATGTSQNEGAATSSESFCGYVISSPDDEAQNLQAGPDDPESGLTGYFYRYDINEGTKRRWGPQALVTAGAMVAGAKAGDMIANGSDERFQQLLEKRGSNINPVALGAAAGGVVAFSALSWLRSSLKPASVSALKKIRQDIANSLVRAQQAESMIRENLEKVTSRFQNFQHDELNRERERSLQEAGNQYEEEKNKYDQTFNIVSASLIAMIGSQYVGGLLNETPPDTVHVSSVRKIESLKASDAIMAAASIATFINNRDASFWPRAQLTQALTPLVSGDDMAKIKRLLWSIPNPPVRSKFRVSGPLETEYNQLLADKHRFSEGQAHARKTMISTLTRNPGFFLHETKEGSEVVVPTLEQLHKNLPD